MADNIEKIPGIATDVPHYNTQVNSVVRGHNSIVEKSAINVIENGSFNYVGNGCRNINILNSSGCVVFDNIVGCTLINSSGINVYEDNLVYINNVRYSATSGGGVTFFNYRRVNSNYTITTDDGTIDVYGGTDHDLPAALGHNKIFNIKNNSGVDININTFGSDTIDKLTDVITLVDYESVTLQSDGVSNYIII